MSYDGSDEMLVADKTDRKRQMEGGLKVD